MLNKIPNLEVPNEVFGDFYYPEINEIRKKQLDVMWTDAEIPVEKDVHEFKTKMTPDQQNLVIITLDTFMEIEQNVGDMWNTISGWFPHPEIDAVCKVISGLESGVHAFFYQKMSDELNIDPYETKRKQNDIVPLKNKLDYVKSIMSNLSNDKLVSLATIAFVEQVLLFSNFAMLKSFHANGYNMLKNTLVGVDFVIQDETLHGLLASYLFNQYMQELDLTEDEKSAKRFIIYEVAREIIDREDAIIDYSFGNKKINDISRYDLKQFVRSRANHVLEQIGMEPLFDTEVNPVADWFYKGNSTIRLHDFFVSGTSQYRRGWSIEKLSRMKFIGEEQ